MPLFRFELIFSGTAGTGIGPSAIILSSAESRFRISASPWRHLE
jgi:hypothetical protein